MNGARAVFAVIGVSMLGLAVGCGSSPKADSGGSSTAAAATTVASGPVDGKYAFWPSAPAEPRIQFAKSFLTRDDVAKREVSGLDKLVFGREVENGETINKPYGVAMRGGCIYVCDIRNSSLTVLDLKRKQTRLVGVSGSATLKHPVAVAVGDDGSLYVADNGQSAILVFDPSERFSRAIGHDQFKPAGIAVHGNRLYASDMTSQTVEVFDTSTGQRLAVIGTVGDEDGQFRLPLGVATDTKGDLYVVDMMRCRVQKFSPDGKFIMGFGALGDGAGSFVRPKHIAVDSEGIIYVVDAAFQNVQMFNSSGAILMFFGSQGKHPGAMDLPAGIAIADDELDVLSGLVHPGFNTKRMIVISNQFGPNRVSLYAMGGLKQGFTANDLAKSAVEVATGVSTRTPEQLKFQNPAALPEGPAAPPAPPTPPPAPAPANPK